MVQIKFIVGTLGIEPRLTPTPRVYVNHYTMSRKLARDQRQTLPYILHSASYFILLIALMHFAQAKTLLPDANLTHCKFGYFLLLTVGLYFPRSFFLFQTIVDFFSQIAHCFAICCTLSRFLFLSKVKN